MALLLNAFGDGGDPDIENKDSTKMEVQRLAEAKTRAFRVMNDLFNKCCCCFKSVCTQEKKVVVIIPKPEISDNIEQTMSSESVLNEALTGMIRQCLQQTKISQQVTCINVFKYFQSRNFLVV